MFVGIEASVNQADARERLFHLLNHLEIKSAIDTSMVLTVESLQRAMSAVANVGSFGVPNQVIMSPIQFESLESILKKVTYTK